MARDASVVIPTFNRRDILRKCLLALKSQSCPPDRFEVIVVDDGSTDGTREMINELEVPYGLQYRRIEKSGPAKARNVGIMMARSNLIIFIDSDLVVVPGHIEAHISAHTAEGLIVNGPVIHTDDPDSPPEKGKLTDVYRAFFATTNTSIEKKWLIKAGMFSEDFVEYGWEDLELGHRLKKLGLRAVKIPEAKGYHIKPQLRLSDLHKHRRRERERGHTAVIFYKKDPTFKTRMQVEMTPLIFGLDRLLTLGNWPEWKSTERFLQFLERNGNQLALRFFVRLITHHDYMEGLREALREEKR